MKNTKGNILKTVKVDVSETFREKGSKFIGHLYPVRDVEKFDKKLDKLKSKYPDATHHCYAYRINPNNLNEFVHDDGEPRGTAGLPILNQLKSFDVANTGLIVVRYFGGTKLGKPGLIDAYGQTARLCLEKAALAGIIRTKNIELSYFYNRQNEIDQVKSSFELIELESEYLEKVTLVLACPFAMAERMFMELDRLKYLDIHYERMGEGFVVK